MIGSRIEITYKTANINVNEQQKGLYKRDNPTLLNDAHTNILAILVNQA